MTTESCCPRLWPISKLFRLAFASHDTEQDYITVLHYSGDDTGSPADVSTGVVGNLTDGLRATLRTSGQLDSVEIVEVLPPGDSGVPEAFTLELGLAGTYSPDGQNVPRALCGLVKLKTDAAVRSGHGWTYAFPLVGANEIINDDTGRIPTTSAYWAGMATLATGVAGEIETSGETYNPAVYSRARHARAEDNWWFTITAAIRSPKVRYLRKREIR